MTQSPWGSVLVSDEVPQLSPISETQSQWGNGGNGATFVHGQGCVQHLLHLSNHRKQMVLAIVTCMHQQVVVTKDFKIHCSVSVCVVRGGMCEGAWSVTISFVIRG